MDSPPATEIDEQLVGESPESRLQRLVPIIRSLAGKVKVLSVVSAGSALVLWWILFDPNRWISGVAGQWAAVAILVLVLLLIPSVAAYVGHLTLKEVIDLPTKLKSAVSETTVQAKEVIVSNEERKGSRLFGFFKAIWVVRGLVLDSKGAWGMAAAVVRLASLPFVVGLLVTFALNFVVIVVTVAAVGLVVVF